MSSARRDFLQPLRILLLMGRASNLPTVWSNCVAGWLLAGGGDISGLNLVILGGTLLYLGGMYLNDAFDAGFDSQHRRDRPIPSGLIRRETAWGVGLGFLIVGWLTLAWLGKTTAVLAAILVGVIVVYNAVHKVFLLAPVLMAACRFFLYLVAASVATAGVSGIAVWSGLALGCYIVGLSYIARREATETRLRWWPAWFLAAPVLLALAVNGEGYYQVGFCLMLLLALWVIRCLHPRPEESELDIKQAVSGLLAGIVWVDLLALAGSSVPVTMLFVGFFLSARLLQRLVPAT